MTSCREARRHNTYVSGCQAKMAAKKQLGGHSLLLADCDIGEGERELFEACKNGDLAKVRRLVSSNSNVNVRDTAGRKSSPLHFAAGKLF